MVHEGEFRILDDEGDPFISDLQIGNSLGSNDNFVNRGDVIVNFDGPADQIKIEFRRFTFAEDEEGAQDDFDKLSLWAYNANTGTPKKPADMEEEARCGGEDDDGNPLPWQQDCAIYVYYDGQNQLKRAGADIRVTLPPNYRQDIGIATADDVTEDAYPNRGNICVSNLNGTVDADLQSGLAFVTLAADVTPSPKCEQANPEGFQGCIDFDDPATEGPDAWSQNCGCFSSNLELGRVTIESLAPSSANITVDTTLPDLWTSFRAENTGENQLNGKHCPSAVEGLSDLEYTQMDVNQPWRLVGVSNFPSEMAPGGAGFTLQLTSNGCEPVSSVEAPDDFDPKVTDPESEVRGNVKVCAGCLAGRSCEDLLPG
ncbi:MAG: hypothetical protein IAG13_09155 [Deltaproteobacteria bacterium]|nr:hypothetical protein [Nannocystaceae bacterium]